MGPRHRSKSTTDRSRSNRSLTDDDRAIEGLPIRLVIALIIGVVSLGIMLQILGGIDTFEGDTEVDMDFEEDRVTIDDNDDTFSVFVVDEDGNEVPEATVVAVPGDARMDDAIVKSTEEEGDENEVVFNFNDEGLTLPPDQHTGTIEFEIQPPSGTNWADDEPNEELLVVGSS